MFPVFFGLAVNNFRVVIMDGADIQRDGVTVNLTELALVTGKGTAALSAMIRRNPQGLVEDPFPIVEVGSKGLDYIFDPRAVAAWLRRNEGRKREAELARDGQLAQLRLDLFGAADHDPELATLSPAQRKAEVEARIGEDRLHRSRAELVERAPLVAALGIMTNAIREEMQSVPAEVARQIGLSHENRMILERMIADKLAGLADRFAVTEYDGLGAVISP